MGRSGGHGAASEQAATRLLWTIERACRRAGEWPDGVRAAVEAALALFAAEPAPARMLLFGPDEAGPLGQMRHAETLARLEGLLRAGRELAAGDLPDTLERGLLGGASFIVSRPLRAEEPEGLPRLAGELTALLLSPYLGREEAERVAGLGG
jgi:hypothetical protein